MLVYQHVSLTQCLLGYLIYTSSILTSSWFFMCCSHEYNEQRKLNETRLNKSIVRDKHKQHTNNAHTQKPTKAIITINQQLLVH